MTARRITDYLVAWRWWLLAIACGLLAAAWGPAQGLQMDRRIEQMFPVGDPSVEAFEILRNRFGGNAVAMLVYRDESLLSPEGLQRAAEIAANASSIPGVLGVLSLAEVDNALARTRPGNLLGISGPPAILGDESLARGFRELFEGYTHDASGTYAAVVVMLDPAQADLHDGVIIALRRLRRALPNATFPDEPPRYLAKVETSSRSQPYWLAYRSTANRPIEATSKRRPEANRVRFFIATPAFLPRAPLAGQRRPTP